MVANTPPTTIAVVIPAYRAEAMIGDCIRGLFAAGFSKEDIVVVDDCSPDRSGDVSADLGVRVLKTETNIGAANARNLGAKNTQSDLLMFVDQDVIVHSDVREVITGFFNEHPDYDAVFGAYDDKPTAPGRVSRIRNLLHRHTHVQSAGDAVTYWTGLGALRREAFDEVGGFDPNQYMMEDIKLGFDLTRAGRRIRLLPELEGTHLKDWSLMGMLRTDLWHRAVPWSRLLLSDAARGLPRSLNVGFVGQASVICVAVSLIALFAALFAPGPGLSIFLLAVIAMALINGAFLSEIFRLGGLMDAVTAVPLLWLHYLCAGTGYAMVRAGY